MPSYKRSKRCTLGPLVGWGETKQRPSCREGTSISIWRARADCERSAQNTAQLLGSLYTTPYSICMEGRKDGREGKRKAQRGWASYSHHQVIVLFLLLKPHPGIPTQFSTCSISLILWGSARNLFFHKIPVTSWNIQLSLSSLNTWWICGLYFTG